MSNASGRAVQLSRASGARMVLVLAFASVPQSFGQAGEVIDLVNLDTRGIVFESPTDGGDSPSADSIARAEGVGDVNGDRFDDIGLVLYDFAWAERRRKGVLIIFGRPGVTGRRLIEPSLSSTIFFVVTPGAEGWSSTTAPTALGDVNGDGLSDFSMSIAPHVDGPQAKVFVVFGAPDLGGDHAIEEIGSKVPGLVLFSSDPTVHSLNPAVRVGDFNGDGSIDMAIGSPGSTNRHGEDLAGLVFVTYDVRSLSSPVDLAEVGTTIPGLRIDGTVTPLPCCEPPELDSTCCKGVGFLGGGILSAGDVDGDGFDDMLVTAAELRPRRVYLIRGASRLPGAMDLAGAETLENVITFLGPSGLDEKRTLGNPDGMASLGDLNGDGFTDIALGLPRGCCGDPRGGPEEDSAVYVFYGLPEFPRVIDFGTISEGQFAFVVRSPALYSRFGSSIAGGDLNQDGLGDLVIGAPRAFPNGMTDAGEAYVLYGRRDYPKEVSLDNAFEEFTLRGEGEFDQLGGELAQPGDFNGDGHPDVLVLARHGTRSPPGRSRVYIIYGTGSEPQPLKLHSVTPSWGTLRGGTNVVLNGSGFEGRAEVFFGDRPAVSVVTFSKSQLRVETPPGAALGSVDVTVRLGGETQRLVQAFEYTPNLPAIDLHALGDQGFILDAQDGVKFTLPAISALAFGDLSGDGVDDLVVEASAPNSWRVTVIRGGADVPPSLLACEVCPRNAMIVTSESRSNSGASVTFLGNVNAEGQKDLAIGASDGMGYILFAPLFDPTGESLGVLDIDAAVLAGSAVRFVRSDVFDSMPMIIFAPIGDITGDGIEDFAVGFAGADVAPLGSSTGDIVFVAGRSSWDEVFDLSESSLRIARIHGSQAGKHFAERLRAVGDVNRDGVVDLLADSQATLHERGRAYLIYGSKNLPADIDVESYISQGGGVVIDLLDGFDAFNWFTVSAAGDVNADGYADILLGVEGGGSLFQGVTYLIYGAADLPNYLELEETPLKPDGIVRIVGERSYEYATRPGVAGDFNVDGFADFVIGAPGFQQFGVEAGNVFLIFGGPSLPDRIDLRRLGSHAIKIDGRNIAGAAGVFAGPAGDFNGDGHSDFAFSEGYSRTGDVSHVYVIYNPFDGVTFIRGDANFDGAVDIADAIFALTYLFLGGASPRCEDSVDADDNGEFEITDAVRILNFLFLGTDTLPTPYPNAGQDVTVDGLECLGF